jgi:hypothetical protein
MSATQVCPTGPREQCRLFLPPASRIPNYLNFTATSNPVGETEGDHLTIQTRDESPSEDFCGSQSNIINNIKCLYGIVTEMISEWLYIRVNHCPNFFLTDLKVEAVDILPGSTIILLPGKILDMT